MNANYYYNKLIEYMMDNTRHLVPSVDAYFLEINNIELTKIKDQIIALFSQNKDYLLNDYYLIYLTTPLSSTPYYLTHNYLSHISHHLNKLLSDDKYKVIREIFDFNNYLFSEYKELMYDDITEHMIMYKPLKRKALESMSDIDYLLRNINNYEEKYDNSNNYYKIMLNTLLIIHSYGIYNRKDILHYRDYIDYILNNMDAYFENLELNDICKKVVLNYELDCINFNSYIKYLDLHLSSELKENKVIR